MTKQNYERAAIAVVTLDVKDVITTSSYTGDLNEGVVLPEDIF